MQELTDRGVPACDLGLDESGRTRHTASTTPERAAKRRAGASRTRWTDRPASPAGALADRRGREAALLGVSPRQLSGAARLRGVSPKYFSARIRRFQRAFACHMERRRGGGGRVDCLRQPADSSRPQAHLIGRLPRLCRRAAASRTCWPPMIWRGNFARIFQDALGPARVSWFC